jgi:hypothetical protein
MQPKLCPRQNFEELFERTQTTWQGNETVRELTHHRFSLVHRGDHSKI